jgi:hypothetical protein
MNTERGKLTPLSQRMAVERYKAKQLAQGMIKVELWIPEHREHEFKELAKLARVELEINGVPYEKTT